MTHDELTDHIVEQVRARDITTLEYAIRVAIDLYRYTTTLSPTPSQPGTGEEVEVVAWRARVNPFGQEAWRFAENEAALINMGIHDREPLVRLSDYQALKAERDEAREYGKQARIRENAAEDARISAHDRALAAEARLSAVEGALKEAAPYVEQAVKDDGGIENCEIGDRIALERVREALTTITGGENER